MLEIIKNFESAAYLWDPVFLVVPGIIGVLSGLLLWIAGLKLSRVVAVILGSIAGAIIGSKLAASSHLAGAFLGASAAAVLSLIFEKVIIILLGSVVITALLVSLLAGNYLDKIDLTNMPVTHSPKQLTQLQTIDSIARQSNFIQSKFGELFKSVPKVSIPLAVVTCTVVIVCGFLFVRLVIALSCSSVGTCLIFAGMVWLLLYKGADPLTHIYERSSFYVLIFAVMVVFGTIVQLLLCSSRVEQPQVEPQPVPARPSPGE